MTGLISKQDAINAVSEYALKHTDLDADKLNGLVKVIMKLQEPQRWISTNEKLPEPGEFVLTISNHQQQAVLCVDEVDDWHDYDGVPVYDFGVEAWMPLPEPMEAFDGAMNPTEE